MIVRPISLRAANAYVERFHRHHKASRGHRFSVCVLDEMGDVLGVAIVGRPVARGFNSDLVAEVTRVCTEGARNACSMLYGAARRACKGMGFEKVITYTLASEDGASLRAAGFIPVARVLGRSWACQSRPRADKHPTEDKIRWEITF